ncbi:hypothetical protein P9112_012631 [Eukaryota sp. TZLM1-RC]
MFPYASTYHLVPTVGQVEASFPFATRLAFTQESNFIVANGSSLFECSLNKPAPPKNVASTRTLTTVSSTYTHSKLFSLSTPITSCSSQSENVLAITQSGEIGLLNLNTKDTSPSLYNHGDTTFPGYHAVSFLSNNQSLSTSTFNKSLAINDIVEQDSVRLEHFHDCIYNFTIQDSNIVHLLETCHLTSVDLRIKNPKVSRHKICSDPLYTITSSSSSMLAVGGVSRTISVIDPRGKCSIVSRVKNVSKYELSHLAFDYSDPNIIYFASLDNEISLCNTKNGMTGFKKRSLENSVIMTGGRVNGLVSPKKYSLFAWSSDGYGYNAFNANMMCLKAADRVDLSRKAVGIDEPPLKQSRVD